MNKAEEYKNQVEEHNDVRCDIGLFNFDNGSVMEVFLNESRYDISKERMSFGEPIFIVEKFNNFKDWKETIDRGKRITKVKPVEEFKKVKRDIVKFENIYEYISSESNIKNSI